MAAHINLSLMLLLSVAASSSAHALFEPELLIPKAAAEKAKVHSNDLTLQANRRMAMGISEHMKSDLFVPDPSMTHPSSDSKHKGFKDSTIIHEEMRDSETIHSQDQEHSKTKDLELASADSTSSKSMQHPQNTETGMCMYTVTVETGKKWGAGTDATISLTLFNKQGVNVYFPSLDNGKNNFEKGQVDEFQVMGQCVDNICKMMLATDNSGFFADWYVETLGFSVSTAGGRQERLWELHQWLPKGDSAASLFVIKDDCTSPHLPPPPAK